MKYTYSIQELIEENKKSEISRIEAIKLPHSEAAEQNASDDYYFFCGAVADSRGHIIGIPSKYSHVLDINPETGEIFQWSDLEVRELKGWCGGCLTQNGDVYGFPRGRDAFLRLDTERRSAEEITIGIDYDSDHHYGGAINSRGVIYCPPRWHGAVLSFDTIKGNIVEIPLPDHLPDNDSFYGAVADFNDNIYFFPRGDKVRVLKCDGNGKLSFIGNVMKDVHFNSGCLGYDGNIYGFGAYKNGILRIDTHTNNIEVLEQGFPGGCFGAKMAFNGKIYGVPGNEDRIVEFDPLEGKIVSYINLPDVQKGQMAKCAGGAIDRFGNIWCVPAMGEYIYKLCFDNISVLPSEELYRSLYFASVY